MAAKEQRTKTPGIYKRGSRYVFSYRVNGKQKWESCRTLEEARLAKSARTTDIERGEFDGRSRVTLHDYANEWIDRYQGRGRRGFRENTRDEYRRVLDQYVLAHFAQRTRLTEVTPSPVATFVGWLCDAEAQGRRLAEDRRKAKAERLGVPAVSLPLTEKDAEGKPLPIAPVTLSDSTIRNIMAPMRACLATAVREGLIRSNPARDVDLPHRPTAAESEQDDVRALSRGELATLLDLVPSQWRTFFWLLAGTGLRVSEAIALQWRHLELDGSSPHVKVRRGYVRGRMEPPKSKHGRREVPLEHSLVLALRQRRNASERPGEEDLVFPAGNGAVMSPGNLRRRVLKPAAEEACVSWVGFHAFRHTCASMLFAEGRNAVQVQRWLGHHSAAFTLATYVHLLDGDLGEPLKVPQGANNVRTAPTPADTEPADELATNLAA
jgi:integrase